MIEPVPYEAGFAGRELREAFNDLLAVHGLVSAFDRPSWGVQLATRRRLALSPPLPSKVDDVVTASMGAIHELGQLVDALALTHGGAPRIFAAANEFSEDAGISWRTLSLYAGSGTYSGSLLTGCCLTENDARPRRQDVSARLSPPSPSDWRVRTHLCRPSSSLPAG